MSALAQRKPSATVFATRSLAAFLTWKQSEFLMLLLDNPLDTRELSAIVTELRDEDIARGRQPYYFGTGYEGVYSTLIGLERRGLVGRLRDGRWALSAAGRRAGEALG